MLGNRISDPGGIEGAAGEVDGLGLLDVETVLSKDKTLEIVSGIDIASGEKVRGYEMHLGLSEGPDRENPWIMLDGGRSEGARSQDGRVLGSYLHGIFAADPFRHAFLATLRSGRVHETAYDQRVEKTLDSLAEHLEEHLDLNHLYDCARSVS
jgi:adenosylcobyric acid synthase